MRWVIGIIMVLVGVIGTFGIGYTVSKAKSKADEKALSKPLGFFALIAIIGWFVIPSFSGNESTADSTSQTNSSSSVTDSKTVMEGGKASFKQDSLVGRTKGDIEMLVKFSSANNEDAIKQMIVDGKAFSVPAGVHVNVLDRSIGSAHLQITDAALKGAECYSIIESLTAE